MGLGAAGLPPTDSLMMYTALAAQDSARGHRGVGACRGSGERRFPGRGELPRAIRDALRCGRDQLVILPAAPARGVRAVGGERASGFPVRRQGAAGDHARSGAGREPTCCSTSSSTRRTALGGRMGPLLVQLPPSLAFDARARRRVLRPRCAEMHGGAVALRASARELVRRPRPRQLLRRHRIARVAADPAEFPPPRCPAETIGWSYFRLHGSPRIYYSDYEPARLARDRRRDCAAPRRREPNAWCIFDNTTLGAATGNALALVRVCSRTDWPTESGRASAAVASLAATSSLCSGGLLMRHGVTQFDRARRGARRGRLLEQGRRTRSVRRTKRPTAA